MTVTAGVRHGTHAAYSYGCRCDLCRAAKSTYENRRRRQIRESLADRLSPVDRAWSTTDVEFFWPEATA